MDTTPGAPKFELTLHDDEFLAVEYSLPHVEHDRDTQDEAERERYDEQILAALVAPSF